MSRFDYSAPDRLQIREGGGCLSLFGLPFFAAGVFLLLTAMGVVPVKGSENLESWGLPVIGLMGIAFTAVGGGLAFGRSWTTLDVTQRAVLKSSGLLVPMKETSRPLDDFTAVTIGFIEGDSDSADRFPVALKAQAGADLLLAHFTVYAEARRYAAEAARHLRVDIEDASTDHAVRLPAGDVNRPLHERVRRGAPEPLVKPPSDPRAEVHQETDRVRIVIPHSPMGRVALAFSMIPLAIPLVFGPSLLAFFRDTRTPEPIGWAIIAFLTLFFGILPTATVVNGFLRSQRGGTIVHVSRRGIRVEERGAWKTQTVADFDADDILDIDYGTRESALASTRRAVEHKLHESGHLQPGQTHSRLERLAETAARWVKGRGVTVKTRQGLTTFGRDLGDEEVRYLHSVVRRALVVRT